MELKAEVCQHLTRINELILERDSALEEKESLKKEKETLEAKRDLKATEKEAAIKNFDDMAAHAAVLEEERDDLAAKSSSLLEWNGQLQDQ